VQLIRTLPAEFSPLNQQKFMQSAIQIKGWKRRWFIGLSILLHSTVSWGANYSSNGTGAWNNASSWSPSGIPVAGDVVTILNGHTITVSSAAAATSVTINTGGTLTLGANFTGNITVNGTLNNSGTASPTITGNLTNTGNGTITVANSTTLTVSGNVTTSQSNGSLLTINGPGLLSVGNFTLGSNDNATISANGKVIVRNNLFLSNQSTMTVNGVLVVKGNFDTANNGNITTTGSGSFSLQGTVDQGMNTITPSLSHCVAADPCVYVVSAANAKCNTVCSALGGVPGSSGSTTLPVTLLSFSATYRATEQRVRLEWITSSEVNNDFFTIERSSDAIHFQAIENIRGAGNSRERLSYVAYDEQPLAGQSYYRLKQTDFDGANSYSKMLVVKSGEVGAGIQSFSVSPNPSEGQQLKINLNGEQGPVTLAIFNQLGQPVYQTSTSVTEGSLEVKMDQPLEAGLYLVKVQKGGQTATQRLLVSRR
jgi:hypothetical protein